MPLPMGLCSDPEKVKLGKGSLTNIHDDSYIVACTHAHCSGSTSQEPKGAAPRGGGNQGAGYKKRLSLTDMDTDRVINAPSIASPAAFGFGPSVAMPTLLGMMPDMPNMEEGADGEGDGEGEGGASVMKYLEDSKLLFTPQVADVLNGYCRHDHSSCFERQKMEAS